MIFHKRFNLEVSTWIFETEAWSLHRHTCPPSYYRYKLCWFWWAWTSPNIGWTIH